jgi:opacity protein-like surface antigen
MQSHTRFPPLLVLVGVCVLMAVPAFSQGATEEDVYARTGPYLGATIIAGSFLNITDQLVKDVEPTLSGGVSRPLETDPALGFDIYVGYRIHKYFAIEAEFEMLPSSDIDFSRTTLFEPAAVGPPPSDEIDFSDGTLAELESMTGTVNAKVFWPLGRFQPFALAGVGVADIELQDKFNLNVRVSEIEVVGRFGGGADFYLTDHVVAHFTVEYLLPGGALSDFDYVSYGAGLQYRF